MYASKQNQGEIAKARGMLQAVRAKLQQVRSTIQEKKAEMQELDVSHQTLEATGDINKMMVVKSKSIALSKSIAGLVASEAECLERVKSVERYLETLNRRLEGLHRESKGLADELASEGLSFEVKEKLKTLSSRIRMQIEALEG